MQTQAQQEVWLRGPLPDITPLLQPAAHALLQAMEEIKKYTSGLNDILIWERPADLASIAFHLQHLTGILDRLFTYADGKELSAPQLEYLQQEGVYHESITLGKLMAALEKQVSISIEIMSHTRPESLTETRLVGRRRIPSTTIGLIFHAAEHTQRHTGQLLATARFLTAKPR
ncbi:MAG: DinB family protein [Chitinophagaceae bacterium]|nr:MAG: DinB family protein [Chitinophagaceae bacterium]